MIKKVLLSFICLLLLTGCYERLKCDFNKTSYIGTFKNGNIVKLNIVNKYKTKKEAKKACASANETKDFYGKNTKVKCSNKKVTIKVKVSKKIKLDKKEFARTFCE